MAKEARNIVCFDLETSGTSIYKAHVLQIAAVALDGDTLEPIPGGRFSSYVQPPDWATYSPDPEAIQVNGITEEVLRTKGRPRRSVWEAFDAYCKQFRVKGAGFGGLPIAAGKNIRHFDLPIVDRVCREEKCASKDGLNKFFDRRRVLELDEVLWFWLEHRSDKPPSYKMDDLREYFGLPVEGGHDAMVDCLHAAKLLQCFLRLFRHLTPRVGFPGSLRKEEFDARVDSCTPS
jgi:DNA polymerase III epsilon subunit-like protein